MKQELIELLQHRESVIADHAWRDRDPETHLQALMDVSGKITAWSDAHHHDCDARLRHYLANASFAKALAHLRDTTAD